MTATEETKPIIKALKKVFNLFGIKKDIKVLLPQGSYKETVDSYLKDYLKKKVENNFVVVYFDFLKNQETGKWERDTYRFWCRFYERLGVGYEGSDVIRLIGQINEPSKDDNSTNKDDWHFKLYNYIEQNKDSYSNLYIETVTNKTKRDELIKRFKAKWESKNVRIVLTVGVPNNKNKETEWTVAGFNDDGKFLNKLIAYVSNDLAVELKKDPYDRNKILELATSYLGRTLKDEDKDKSTIELIENKDYSLTRVSHHGSEEKNEHKFKLSYLIAALKESVLWGFKPGNNKSKILIVDDRLYDSEKNTKEKDKIRNHIVAILKICKQLSIDCYGLVKHESEAFSASLQEASKSILDKNTTLKSFLKMVERDEEDFKFTECKFKEKDDYSLLDFDYLFVDLWYNDKGNGSMRGLDLISEIHHKLQEIIRKTPLTFVKDDDVTNLQANETKKETTKIPEIVAYSISKDAETIQMAQRMGAAGYVHKGNHEGLPLAIVRAGPPLELNDATRLDYFTTNNFPCIATLPRQIIKALFNSKISVFNADGQVEKADDLTWIRSIPKADNHVHFGTAIPLEWCYILSLISLYHWNHYWEKQGEEKYKKYKDKIAKITEKIGTIIKNTLDTSKAPEIHLKPDGFRRRFLHFFSEEYQCAEVIFLKDVINYLVKISDKSLSDNQIACLINVLLGNLLYGKNGEKSWRSLYEEAKKRIGDVKHEVEIVEKFEKNEKDKKYTHLHNLKCFRDCKHLIKNIELPRFHIFKKSIFKFINVDYETEVPTRDSDPLSEMLSTGEADNPYGLERYLASTCLVGSSLLQFADTVLLASMSIPEWAAAKKAKKNSEPDEPNPKEEVTDNVIHLELRTTPQGFLNPYDSEKSNGTLATKLICVGLEFGIKKLFKTPDAVTANLLISIKRDRDREDIIPCINTAVDMRDEYLNYIKDNKISEAEGFTIPHVSGLDVAGIERNNLPAELQPFYKEAFERCLLSTIHAGETERAQSVKDAIFMLNASRIGHGLSIQQDEDLKRLIAERRICVELCPKSNQFTNGFKVFRQEAKGDKDNTRQKEYVYNYDDIRGKMLLTINTDNPTISHKASNCESFAYPLSEEFIWLSGMINREKQIPLSRLEVLSLIYNGFVSMFAPEQAKKSIISLADQEVLSILAAEYLDIGKE